ncbi:MAG: hypothetical protein IIB53_12435 [Planctomycetes bacterium]|nr:hypothetical protein [Planctomycetota bacterium]
MKRRTLSSMAALPLCAAALMCSPVRAQHGEHGQHEQEEGEFSQPKTYSQAIHVVQRQLDRIKDLIATRKLDRVHAEAAVIRDVAKIMARLALQRDSAVPREAIREINLTAKDLAARFGPIDEAGDSGDRAGTQKVYDEMVALFETLKKFAPSHEQAYACPMSCEGYKTYDEAGNCPVCRMGLKTVSADWTNFSAQVTAQSGSITPGEQVALDIILKDGDGKIVRKLQTRHEKLLHLIMVSEDLSWFAHEHPQLQSNGTFSLASTFPMPGTYVLFHDFAPTGIGPQVAPAVIHVEGTAPAPVKLKVDASMTKRVDGYTVTITTNGPVTAGEEVVVSYNLAHDRKPVTNLDSYLGALGHLIFISSDLEHYVHSHPLGAEHDTAAHQDDQRGVGRHREHDEHGGSAQSSTSSLVSFHALFPEAGLYKGWAQFKHQGRVITVPWVVDVKPSDNHDEHGERDRRAGHDH